jgi:3-oxoacyl-[acyl-carrier protein] reductase
MNIQFINKRILITGATRGIGKQIADDLEKLGAELILTGTHNDEVDMLNEQAVQKQLNRKYVCVNLLDPESLEQFLTFINIQPRIDGLVNNAGINRLNAIQDVVGDDWNDMINVNLTAPFRVLQAVSRSMIANNYGRVVNISSIFGKISKEKRVAYSATKFGLHGLTVGASNDLGKHNILVNTVSPGFVLTDLTRKNLSENEMNELAAMVPVKRLANVSDISSVVVFMLSEWNQYINGQNIIVDGGFTNI